MTCPLGFSCELMTGQQYNCINFHSCVLTQINAPPTSGGSLCCYRFSKEKNSDGTIYLGCTVVRNLIENGVHCAVNIPYRIVNDAITVFANMPNIGFFQAIELPTSYDFDSKELKVVYDDENDIVSAGFMKAQRLPARQLMYLVALSAKNYQDYVAKTKEITCGWGDEYPLDDEDYVASNFKFSDFFDFDYSFNDKLHNLVARTRKRLHAHYQQYFPQKSHDAKE